jgi:hypothetical protein
VRRQDVSAPQLLYSKSVSNYSAVVLARTSLSHKVILQWLLGMRYGGTEGTLVAVLVFYVQLRFFRITRNLAIILPDNGP